MKTLRERVDWVLQNRFDGNESAWARAAGLPSRVHVGKLLERDSADAGKVHLDTIAKLAAAANVSPAWLAFGIGAPEDDPPFSAVLMGLQLRPGLSRAIESNPDRWRTSTIARALSTHFQSGEDGVPLGGWEKALDTLQTDATHVATAKDVAKVTSIQVGRRPKLPKK